MIRLGVNIDHVATLRQARGCDYPSVVEAAKIALSNGADQITVHLREDRRHIQDTDVEAVQLVTKKYGKPLNLEMGCNREITEIAVAIFPDWVCLVPENRAERTTEGGLNLLDEAVFERVAETIKRLRAKGEIKVSLFLESKIEILRKGLLLKPDAVEIHTGFYAHDFQDKNSLSEHLNIFKMSSDFIRGNGIGAHAGHGLTLESVVPLLEKKLFAEYNIGHWIVAQSLFDGMGSVVKSMKDLLKKYE